MGLKKLRIGNVLAKRVALLLFLIGSLNTMAQSEPRFTEVNPTTETVTITNVGDMTEDISNYWLCLGPGTYVQLSTVTPISGGYNLMAGNSVRLNYTMPDANGGLSLFSTSTFTSTDPAVLKDYLQYGAANQPRVTQAVTAGRWDNASNFATAGTSYSFSGGSGDVGSTFYATCAAVAGEITFDTAGISATTSISPDGTSAVICIDGNADPLGVTVAAGSVGTNSGWIITNAANDEILALPSAPPFNLDGAGTGTCEIWYVRYESDFAGNMVGNNLSDLTGCYDLSEPIEVIREAADGGTVAIDLAATGNPNNTTSFVGTNQAVICVDSQADPLVITHSNPAASNLSYRYVITNEDSSEILAISASSTIDLNGAGVGTCRIWGWSYRGLADNGASFVGSPLADLQAVDCSDISDNSVEVIREAADGGTVAIDLAATGNPNNTTSFVGTNQAVICVDSQADPLVITHSNPAAENLSYRYVITNEDSSEILAISASSTIDLNGAGVGTCRIWGWSYRGLADNGASFIGSPLADLQAVDCSDISDNSVEVIREAADGGTVAIDLAATGNPNNTTSFVGTNQAVICVDSQADPLVITHSNPAAENLSYRYVITNEDSSEILAISASSTIDLNGAGVGTCRIWGWSYRGLADNGASFVGSPLADLQAVECSDISSNSVEVIREAADGGTVAIDLAATGNPNNTTSFVGTNQAVICVDSQADPLVITHSNPAASNLSYRYVITNEDSSEILAISASSTIDLNGAGVGTCRIWGWSYRGLADNGASFVGSPLADLQAVECSDISSNSVEVIREAADGGTVAIDLAATGNPNNTTSFVGTNQAVICVDSQADPLVITHSNPAAENLSYRYVITNEDSSEILAISASSTIDLNGAGVGTCRIWGWSYRGLADNGASFIGSPLADLQAVDCSDISDNSVEVIREAADGGTVAIDLAATGNPNNTTSFVGTNQAVICVDSQADPLVITHSNPAAENLSYRYVITNEDSSEILAISASSTIDLNGAGVGTCRIWGWSYRGLADNGASFVGSPLADLQAADNGASFVGSPLADLQAVDCSDISDNSVEVIREAADGGTVAIDLAATGNPNNTTSFNGDTEAVICVDGNADPLVVVHDNDAPNLTYQYVITNEDSSEILAISSSSSINLDGAGVGNCRIWGWSYRGLAGGAAFIGSPLADLQAEDCSDISSNSVLVIREAADGGTVAIDLAATGNPNNTTSFNGDTEAVICVDGNADPLVVVHDNDAPNLTYQYVITNEDSSEILAISSSSSINLDGAGVGNCRIWGWSYRGLAGGTAFIGSPLADLQAEDCSDISSNSVLVIREAADGGTVAIDLAATGNPNNTTSFNGDTEAVICVDGNADPLVVVHDNDAPNLTYQYVITNEDSSEILAISSSSSINLDGAGVGNCRIWGWSYRGLAGGAAFIGSPLADLQAEDCSDISSNSILVIREAADGGTVSLDGGGLEATICAGDGIPNPLDVVHSNPLAENLSYRYVITNEDSSEILAISASSSIDLDGAGAGICRIWGWSYRGLADNGASFIGSPLADLQAVDCSDISDNSIMVTRLTGTGCDVLSTDDIEIVNVNIFPNPVVDVLNLQLASEIQLSGLKVEIYDLSGRMVYTNRIEQTRDVISINLQSLSNGLYLMNIVDDSRGALVIRKFIKQ